MVTLEDAQKESLAGSVIRTINDFSKLPPEAKAAQAKLFAIIVFA